VGQKKNKNNITFYFLISQKLEKLLLLNLECVITVKLSNNCPENLTFYVEKRTNANVLKIINKKCNAESINTLHLIEIEGEIEIEVIKDSISIRTTDDAQLGQYRFCQ